MTPAVQKAIPAGPSGRPVYELTGVSKTFEARHPGALQAYLRQAITNHIRDEIRRVNTRPAPAELLEATLLALLIILLHAHDSRLALLPSSVPPAPPWMARLIEFFDFIVVIGGLLVGKEVFQECVILFVAQLFGNSRG